MEGVVRDTSVTLKSIKREARYGMGRRDMGWGGETWDGAEGDMGWGGGDT